MALKIIETAISKIQLDEWGVLRTGGREYGVSRRALRKLARLAGIPARFFIRLEEVPRSGLFNYLACKADWKNTRKTSVILYVNDDEMVTLVKTRPKSDSKSLRLLWAAAARSVSRLICWL